MNWNFSMSIFQTILLPTAQVSPSQITASATSANSENLKKMKVWIKWLLLLKINILFSQALGVNATTSNNMVMTSSDIIIIAVKPHYVLSVLSDLHDCYVSAQSSGNPPKNLRPLIVSVAAAITISDIESKVSYWTACARVSTDCKMYFELQFNLPFISWRPLTRPRNNNNGRNCMTFITRL